jgi:hypothetical protein
MQHLNQLTASDRSTAVPPQASASIPGAAPVLSSPSVEELSDMALPGAISIGAMDLEAEYVTICNNSSNEISMDGWSLYSTRGQQRHLFPSDVRLQCGEKLVVWSGPRSDGGHDTAGVQHLVWSGRNMWNGASMRGCSDLCCCFWCQLVFAGGCFLLTDAGDTAMLVDERGSILDQVCRLTTI